MFPYKIRRFQQVRPLDLTGRKRFAIWCFDNMHSDLAFLRSIVFSDECVIYISRVVKNQNARFWESDNQRLIQEDDGSSENLTVWCTIYSDGVLDLYYFDNETVRGENYHRLLNTYVRNPKHFTLPKHLFQQDGATAHSNNLFPSLLQELFPSSWTKSMDNTIGQLDHLI